MRRILKYINFKTSEEFEEFQKDERIIISQVIPFVGDVNINHAEKTQDETSEEDRGMDAVSTMHVFVIYFILEDSEINSLEKQDKPS